MMIIYTRMIARFWRLCIARETHYRANFITMILVAVLEIVLTILPMLLLYTFAGDVAGWTQAEALALVGLFRVAVSLYLLVAGGGVLKLSDDIQRGNLDLILIRPVNSQFYVTFRYISLPQIVNVMIGAVVFAIGMSQSSISSTAFSILQAVIVFTCGLVLFSSAILAGSYIAFRTTTIEGLPWMLQDLAEMGRYPISFYPAGVRIFLTAIMPVAFVTVLPMNALRGTVGWEICIVAIPFTGLAIVMLRWWWNNSVRHYSSASS